MKNLEEHKESQSSNNFRVNKSFLLAAIFSVLSYQSGSFTNEKPNFVNIKNSEIPANKENKEEIGSYEKIFKNGIRLALDGLDSISGIPIGGKKIEYYRDDSNPTLAGKKMSPNAVKGNNLPDKFNISPRVITSPVSSMNFHLSNRTFNIDPWLGNIQNVKLDSVKLCIETTFTNIEYDKKEELPRLMLKLWRTPAVKGKKEGFRGSTVREL